MNFFQDGHEYDVAKIQRRAGMKGGPHEDHT